MFYAVLPPCLRNHLLNFDVHWRKQLLVATGADMGCGQIINIENHLGLNAMQVYRFITMDIDAIQIVKRRCLVHNLLLLYILVVYSTDIGLIYGENRLLMICIF
jgi:hypothetical protein